MLIGVKGTRSRTKDKTSWSASRTVKNNKQHTVGMTGTITGLVRIIRVLYADAVCGALRRMGSIECKVAVDDVFIEASSLDEECE